MKTIHHLITIGIHLGLILALMTGSAQAAAPRSELPDPGGRPGAQTISDFPPVSPSPQALALSSPGDEFWSDDFYASGANGPVYALLADGNDLFVGGSFSTIGPLLTNNIARWDGSTWSALGSGLTSSVYALAMDSHGNLYAACNSDDYWGVPSTINRWDGSTWTQLGGGIDGFVETLAMDHNNNLYAGGQFDNIGNVSVNHIARWDGSTWSALGGGVSGTVNDLVVDGDGMLYAGGTFYNSYGNNVARWDGNSWATGIIIPRQKPVG